MFWWLIYPGALIAVIALLAFGVSEVKKGGIMKSIKVIYTLTIMAFLIMLVAFGISALYEGPEYSGYGSWQAYEADQRDYARNVFFISYPCGVLFVILGLILKPRLDVIKPGLLLGGMGTIIYAISQPELAEEFRFGGVAIGLVILLFIGYRMLLERKTDKDNSVNTVT